MRKHSNTTSKKR